MRKDILCATVWQNYKVIVNSFEKNHPVNKSCKSFQIEQILLCLICF